MKKQQSGGSAESLDEIRQNALANFASQGRVVTKEDYIIRTYTMPQGWVQLQKHI